MNINGNLIVVLAKISDWNFHILFSYHLWEIEEILERQIPKIQHSAEKQWSPSTSKTKKYIESKANIKSILIHHYHGHEMMGCAITWLERTAILAKNRWTTDFYISLPPPLPCHSVLFYVTMYNIWKSGTTILWPKKHWRGGGGGGGAVILIKCNKNKFKGKLVQTFSRSTRFWLRLLVRRSGVRWHSRKFQFFPL